MGAVDVPARQVLVIELVEGPEDLTGAIALNSALFNSARLIGPSLGGLMIAAWGTGAAFLANAVSYVAVILALLATPAESVNPVAQRVSLLMGIRDGVRFVRRTPHVLWVLMVLGVLALFRMNFEIFVPVLARTQLHVGAAGFGFLMAVQGAGALVGAQAYYNDFSGGLQSFQRLRPLIGDDVKRDLGSISKEPVAAEAVVKTRRSVRRRESGLCRDRDEAEA